MEQSQHDKRASRFQKFWMPYTGKELPLSCEEGNVYDKHVVAVHYIIKLMLLLLEMRLERCHVSSGFTYNMEVPVKTFLYLGRSFTCNSFHMTATFSLAHAFNI